MITEDKYYSLEELEQKELLSLEEFKALGHARLQQFVSEYAVC